MSKYYLYVTQITTTKNEAQQKLLRIHRRWNRAVIYNEKWLKVSTYNELYSYLLYTLVHIHLYDVHNIKYIYIYIMYATVSIFFDTKVI